MLSEHLKRTASAPRLSVIASLLALAIIFIVAGLLFWQRNNTTIVRIGTASIEAEVSDSEQERERGLSGAVRLDKNSGMLFVFPYDDRWSIWMKDMKVPIDIIWLDTYKKVIAVESEVAPATYPAYFTPPANARYVLEIASGEAQRFGIVPGLEARFDVPAATK